MSFMEQGQAVIIAIFIAIVLVVLDVIPAVVGWGIGIFFVGAYIWSSSKEAEHESMERKLRRREYERMLEEEDR